MKDGTAAGTVVKDIASAGQPSNPASLINVDACSSSATEGFMSAGVELWRATTTAGTVRVRDIQQALDPAATLLTAVGGTVVSCNDGTNGIELWKSMTAAGTVWSGHHPGAEAVTRDT